MFFGSLLFWLGALYLSSTQPVPTSGGSYSEGVIGQPRYVNPVLSPANAPDEDLVELIYAGLLGYDARGYVVERLADRVDVSEDGKEYTVHIRDDALFHDGEPVRSDDVVFTISLIQDPVYKSPLRQKWQGIEARSENDSTVIFTLTKPYAGFREHLTIGILPKHVWQDVSAERFPLTDLNLMPVGAGPYRFFDFKKDSEGNILSYQLRAFKDFVFGEPYITGLTLSFYPDEDSLVRAYERKEILGTSPISVENISSFADYTGTEVLSFQVPRVFAVFFNPVKSVPLGYEEVRKALSYAVNREELVREALSGYGVTTRTPFLSFMKGEPAVPDIPESVDEANRSLDEAGWERQDDGIRSKDDVRLSFRLVVPDWPELRATADILAGKWREIGVETQVDIRPIAELNKDAIRPREYEALLYGEEMSIEPDFYSFWHSSEKETPGLNLAMFDDASADELLLSLRETREEGERHEKIESFLSILAKQHPAIFLYSPDVLLVRADIVDGWDLRSGNSISSRFVGVERWFMKTKRVFK